MTARQKKILFAVAGVYLAAMVLYAVVTQWFLEPARAHGLRKQQLQTEIANLIQQNGLKPRHEARYRQISKQVLPGNETEAGSYLADTLMTLLDCGHLGGKLIASRPLEPKPKFGFDELGHAMKVRGKLAYLVDLLYLLESQPFLHRLDNLMLSRQGGGEFDLSFTYSALAVDARNKRVKPARQPTTESAPPVQNLESPERRQYDAIASRDLFRPYVKRVVEVVRPPEIQRPEDPPQQPEPPKARRQEFFVCGLVTWDDGRQEIAIRNGSNGEVRCYKPGDRIEGAEVVMIDYRPIPRADNPRLDSPSRLILKIGQDYWAVEIERSLSDKRLMKADQLPPELHTDSH